MSLTGTFSTMPLSDLLQWLGDARKSGVLIIALEFEERRVRIEQGEIVALGSDDSNRPRGGDLGRVVMEAGLLDEAQLLAALEAVEEGRPLAEVLAREGLVRREVLDAAIGAHVERVVLGMFLWREGRFHFTEGEGAGAALSALGEASGAASPSPSPTAPTSAITYFGGEAELRLESPLPLRGLLMEGMRRLDEWQRIVEVLPSDYCQVHALGREDGLPILDELLARGEPVSLGELWGRGADRYRIYEQLFQAYHRGLLAVDAQVPITQAGEPQNPLDALIDTARVLVDERQYDEGEALLRSVLNFDPGRVEARDLLRRARAEQLAELYQTIPPHRVPVLRLPREQLGRVALSQRERHLAARINGRWDVGALVVVTPLGELETMRALRTLLHVGAIALGD